MGTTNVAGVPAGVQAKWPTFINNLAI